MTPPGGTSRAVTRPVSPRRGASLLTACLLSLVACGDKPTVGENAEEFSRRYCDNWEMCNPSGFKSAYGSQAACRGDWHQAVLVGGVAESEESKGGSVPICLKLMKADACYFPSSYSEPPLPPVLDVAACRDLFEK